MNRSAKITRRLYPDPTGRIKGYGPLRVYWLEVHGEQPARSDYDKYSKKPDVLAALTMIDKLLGMNGPAIPKSKMETISYKGIKFYEIKAPPRGSQIFRLLAYRENEWELFVAVAREKKSQSLPDEWKDLAAKRIKSALLEGRPL